MKRKINFHKADVTFAFDKNRIRLIVDSVFFFFGKTFGQIDVILCSDDYLLDINQRHLNHDYFTDVITFNYATDIEPIVSDIFISVDRIHDHGKVYNVAVQDEFTRVVTHACLHLVGFEDSSVPEKLSMRAHETLFISL